MKESMKVICCVGMFFNLITLSPAQILPEPLIPFGSHNSVCYGPGTHGQFRPSCPEKDNVIAVQNIKMGAKPTELDCPSSVTELTDHSGSYLVDHADISKILNESACCFPDEEKDCIKVLSYINSGLEYKYHVSSSGYPESVPNMEVSWEKTSCSTTSEYPTATHYMYMEYSCIERRRIGNMCSNNTFMVINSAFYLYNTDYPESVKATVDVCQCRIKTNSTNIQFYSIDMRLQKFGNYCKQSVNLTDSNGTTLWDCESTPIFNVTKLTKNQEITITLRNDLPIDGGHIWVGVSAEGDNSTMLIINCNYQLKQRVIQSTTPIKDTTFTKGSTLGNVPESTTQSPFIGNGSTTAAKVTENLYQSKETSLNTLTLPESTVTTEGIPNSHEPAVSTTRRSALPGSTTVNKGSSIIESTTSAVHIYFTSTQTTPGTKPMFNQQTVVIKDYQNINIVYVICGTILLLILVLLVFLCFGFYQLMKKRKRMFQVDPEKHDSSTGNDTNRVIPGNDSNNGDANEIPTLTPSNNGRTGNTQPGRCIDDLETTAGGGSNSSFESVRSSSSQDSSDLTLNISNSHTQTCLVKLLSKADELIDRQNLPETALNKPSCSSRSNIESVNTSRANIEPVNPGKGRGKITHLEEVKLTDSEINNIQDNSARNASAEAELTDRQSLRETDLGNITSNSNTIRMNSVTPRKDQGKVAELKEVKVKERLSRRVTDPDNGRAGGEDKPVDEISKEMEISMAKDNSPKKRNSQKADSIHHEEETGRNCRREKKIRMLHESVIGQEDSSSSPSSRRSERKRRRKKKKNKQGGIDERK